MKSIIKNKRIYYAILSITLLVIEVLIAIFVHDRFVRPYIGDILVVILIYCFVRIFIPKRLRLLPLYVFLFAVMVEISQYFNLIGLLGLSGNKIAAAVMGTSFDWHDILCYALGCIICAIFSRKNSLQ